MSRRRGSWEKRPWVLDGLSLVEVEPGRRWALYVAHWLRDVRVGEVIRKVARIEFRDRKGRLRLSWPNEETYESSDDLSRYAASAPAWLVFGWRSRSDRLRGWRRRRAKARRAARNLHQRFEAAYHGPRWNSYPIDYANLPEDRIKRGLRSSVKRLRKKLGVRPVSYCRSGADSDVYVYEAVVAGAGPVASAELVCDHGDDRFADHRDYRTKRRSEMIAHLREHAAAGLRVPERVIAEFHAEQRKRGDIVRSAAEHARVEAGRRQK